MELVSFSGTRGGSNVKLEWSTATEINNFGYVIEKSNGKEAWHSLGFIKGNGTSTSRKVYSFTDNTPRNGINYYQLKQTDVNGTFNYSNIIEVNFNGIIKFNLLQNFPNPFNPSTVIRFEIPTASHVNIKVYNIIGKEVAELLNDKLEGGNHEIVFNANNLPSGLYIYKIAAGNFISSKKMMLVK